MNFQARRPCLNLLQKRKRLIRLVAKTQAEQTHGGSASLLGEDNFSNNIIECVHNAIELLFLPPKIKKLILGNKIWPNSLEGHLKSSEFTMQEAHFLCSLLFMRFDDFQYGYNIYTHLMAIERALINSSFHFEMNQEIYKMSHSAKRSILSQDPYNFYGGALKKRLVSQNHFRIKIAKKIKSRNSIRSLEIKKLLNTMADMTSGDLSNYKNQLVNLLPSVFISNKVNTTTYFRETINLKKLLL